MPADMTRYPKSWPEFSRWIRYTRAEGRCECTGQCGLHRSYSTPRRCIERHHTAATYATGTVRLTVAHLCNCDPPCANPNHVKAMCQRCHLRTDRYLHARRRRETLQSRQESRQDSISGLRDFLRVRSFHPQEAFGHPE